MADQSPTAWRVGFRAEHMGLHCLGQTTGQMLSQALEAMCQVHSQHSMHIPMVKYASIPLPLRVVCLPFKRNNHLKALHQQGVWCMQRLQRGQASKGNLPSRIRRFA